MPAKTRRKKGASKSGAKSDAPRFYAMVLDEAEQLDFELAAGVNGIDDEIALLRVKIKTLVGNDPQNLRLLVEATNALERLVRTRYRITREQRKGLKEAIGNVLKDIIIPLGISVGGAVLER
ncbi:MAG: hypothetical protein ABID87_01395 [Chloroflexota bacterium]